MSDELTLRTHKTLDFMDSLYQEIAALFREVENQLKVHHWQILKLSGYRVTFRNSMGLSPVDVPDWYPTAFTVGFVKQGDFTLIGGCTQTQPKSGLKLPILRIELRSQPGMTRPRLLGGFIEDVKVRNNLKVEKYFTDTFTDDGERIFPADGPLDPVVYDLRKMGFTGHFFETSLFRLQDRAVVKDQVVDRILALVEGRG